MTSMIGCIVGKKIGGVGPGLLELFPFVVLAILCVSKHLFCVKDFSRTTLPRILKYSTHDKYDWLYCGTEKKGLWGQVT